MTFLFDFIQRWLGGLSGVMFSFALFFFCVLAVGAFWDRRLRLVELACLLSCALALAFLPFLAEKMGASFAMQPLLPGAVLGALYAILTVLYLRREQPVLLTGETTQSIKKGSLFASDPPRSIRGTRLGVPLAILIAVSAVLATGLSTPQVMVGDEVTHYYMLTHQAKDLSQPNFYAEIPMASGEHEIRRYPHSFFWHYFGALVYTLSGGSLAAVQVYQSLFLLQLLGVAYLLARDRQGVESRSALSFVLVLASLPLCLIFSVTFYQDVPMTAQIVTAFYLLRRGHWLPASLFLSLAIGLKVTAVLFYPSFFLLLLYWQVAKKGWFSGFLVCGAALLIVLGSTWFIGRSIVTYGQSEFYPQAQMERLLKRSQELLVSTLPVMAEWVGVDQINTSLSARPDHSQQVKEDKPPIIANHPGDLRIKENYLVYGGIIIWLVVAAGLAGQGICRLQPSNSQRRYRQSSLWLYIVGGSYTLLAAWLIRTSPDARFFLPGLPFLLLPFLEKASFLPKPKILISLLAALALLQGSYVLQKTYRLRALTPETLEGIRYLTDHPPQGKIFMYPEGNYRFFPAQHEWYLGYRLREFWRADNAKRTEMLHRFGVSAVVIKKHLVAPVDDEITNLGVYPIEFVNDIQRDASFLKGFENDALLIYFLLPLQKE